MARSLRIFTQKVTKTKPDTRLSVNINKIATLRNARGENTPDLEKVAIDCQRFGAEGITVHPRPDERHIRRADVFALRPLLDVGPLYSFYLLSSLRKSQVSFC